jgi:predicted Zn-dependent protease
MQNGSLKIAAAALLIFSGVLSRAQQQQRITDDFAQVAAHAEQARSMNQIEEAIVLYRKALSLNPRWTEGWWYLGTLLYDQDDFSDAAKALANASALNAKIGNTWVMLGLCEFKLGQHDDALKHIQKGRQLGTSGDPQFRVVMLYHEGLLLLRTGEFERAQDTLDLLSSEGVDNEDLIIALGLAVLHIRWSDRTNDMDPLLREILRRAGRAEHLTGQKKFDEASVGYDRLATDFPNMQGVQYAYGRFLIGVNEEEKAIAAFKREIKNSPNHLQARLAIADTKLRLKDVVGGLPYAEEAVKLYPQVPLGHLLFGLLLLDADQTTRAIAELEIAQHSLPNEPKIYFALGRAYARAGRNEDADRARATFTRLNNQTQADAEKRSQSTQVNPVSKTKSRIP